MTLEETLNELLVKLFKDILEIELTTLANRRSSLCVIREEQTKNGCH